MESWITTATSSEELERAAGIAVLPVGSFEQHSTFLPLITDTIVACLIAKRISADYNLFLLPPITFSCSQEHAGFVGTVSISAKTLYVMIDDVTDSLRRGGISKLVVVNGHGGNYVLSNIVQEATIGEARMTLFPSRTDWDRAREEAGLETSHSKDMHAGELEVSLLLHACPEAVRGDYRNADFNVYPRPHLLVTGMRAYTESGVLGAPSLGTAEKGKLVFDSLSRCFKGHLEVLSR